jgi:hypothetical protein
MEEQDFKVYINGIELTEEEITEDKIEQKGMGIIDVENIVKEILHLDRLSLERIVDSIDLNEIVLDERNHHVNTDLNKENFNKFKIKVFESILAELDNIYNSYLTEIKRDFFVTEFYESLLTVTKNGSTDNINKITEFNSNRNLLMLKADKIKEFKEIIEIEINARKPKYLKE